MKMQPTMKMVGHPTTRGPALQDWVKPTRAISVTPALSLSPLLLLRHTRADGRPCLLAFQKAVKNQFGLFAPVRTDIYSSMIGGHRFPSTRE